VTACPHCAAPWREGARFCGRCGRAPDAPAGKIEEHAAVGTRGLGIALTAYFACLVPILVLTLVEHAGTTAILWANGWFLLVGLVGAALIGREAWALLGPPSLGAKGTLLAIVVTAAVWAIAVGLGYALPSLYLDETLPYKAEGKTLAFVLLDLAVVTPIVEELVFRGVVFTGLRGVFPKNTAIIVSGLLFSTIHLAFISFFDHALFGVILAAVCLRSRSIWPGVLLHAAWNGAIVLLHW
jgi:membrane protease YdiL (CAAX protease family)